MIGREYEKDMLAHILESKRPEFLVLYGRRRVGKTYLIKEFFKERFAFYATGLTGEKTRGQLKAFHKSLQDSGSEESVVPKDWFEAFSRLRSVLESPTVIRDSVSGKRVVFLDELPWMDTARSDFKSALDYFWNTWGSTKNDLLLIVCGSATSWIINNILADTGGFYNRVTRQMYLRPFSLYECEKLFESNGMHLTRKQQMDSYMVFGGIPYYLNLLDERLSVVQNIDELLFRPDGQLFHEYDNLFYSLFKNAENHVRVIHTLSEKKSGLTRVDIADKSGIGDGAPLTRALSELEQCGFIRKYKNVFTAKNGCFYQIIDPFVLFSQSFFEKKNMNSWSSFIHSSGYYAWAGNAFEILCLNHIREIKEALGISGMVTHEFSWRSKEKKDGAQIDLLIDRNDDVINICEMKYTNDQFVIDASYEKQLYHKMDVFRTESATKKAIVMTLVSANGLKQSKYSGVVGKMIEGDELFRP